MAFIKRTNKLNLIIYNTNDVEPIKQKETSTSVNPQL